MAGVSFYRSSVWFAFEMCAWWSVFVWAHVVITKFEIETEQETVMNVQSDYSEWIFMNFDQLNIFSGIRIVSEVWRIFTEDELNRRFHLGHVVLKKTISKLKPSANGMRSDDSPAHSTHSQPRVYTVSFNLNEKVNSFVQKPIWLRHISCSPLFTEVNCTFVINFN